MFRWNPGPRAPLSLPLSGPQPNNVDAPDPVLVLGIMNGMAVALGDVFRNDLVYSRTTQLQQSLPRELDDSVLLHILNFVSGEDLLTLCEVYQGSKCVDDLVLYDAEGDVKETVLDGLKQQRFQAIVVADNCISEEPVAAYIREEYESYGTNVVVMAMEGLFNLSYMRQFGVSWSMLAYTKRTVYLTESGRRLLGEYAFPVASKYCKGHFVVGDQELFAELVEEEQVDEDDDVSLDPPQEPAPGSPVVVHNEAGRCVSYFGFVNSLDVSYGAMILRLCYADKYLGADT